MILILTLTEDLDFGNKERVLPEGIYVKYGSSITYHSKALANVKGFVAKQKYNRGDGKLYAPDLSMMGREKKRTKVKLMYSYSSF